MVPGSDCTLATAAKIVSWFHEGNCFTEEVGAGYLPEMDCVSVASEDDATWGEMTGCEVPDNKLMGHWYQPAFVADGYAGTGTARFGKGDDLAVRCHSLAAMSMGADFALTIEAGAAALTAGAAFVAAAMY